MYRVVTAAVNDDRAAKQRGGGHGGSNPVPFPDL